MDAPGPTGRYTPASRLSDISETGGADLVRETALPSAAEPVRPSSGSSRALSLTTPRTKSRLQRQTRVLRCALPWLTFVVLCAVSAAAFAIIRDVDASNSEEEAEASANLVASRIEDEYERLALRIRTLSDSLGIALTQEMEPPSSGMAAVSHVDEQAFLRSQQAVGHALAALVTEYEYLSGAAVAVRVAADRVGQMQARLEALVGAPAGSLNLTTAEPGDTMRRPPSPAAYYWPIVYHAELATRYQAVAMLDVGSAASRQRLINFTLTTGSTAASDPIPLIGLDVDNLPRELLYQSVPVCNWTDPLVHPCPPPAARAAANSIALLITAFDHDDMLAGVLATQKLDSSVAVRLSMASSGTVTAKWRWREGASVRTTHQFQLPWFQGRRLVVTVTSGDTGVSTLVSTASWSILVGGVLLSAMLKVMALAYLRSIARREELERRSALAQQRATLKRDALLDFLRKTSHDVRTPLHSLTMALDELRETIPHVALMDSFATARRSTCMLGLVMDNVLDESQVDTGTLQLHWSPCNVGELLASLVDMTRALLADTSVTLEYHQPRGAVPALCCDKRRIWRCVLNVLNNSRRYTRHGRIALSVAFYSSPEAALHARNGGEVTVEGGGAFTRIWRHESMSSSGRLRRRVLGAEGTDELDLEAQREQGAGSDAFPQLEAEAEEVGVSASGAAQTASRIESRTRTWRGWETAEEETTHAHVVVRPAPVSRATSGRRARSLGYRDAPRTPSTERAVPSDMHAGMGGRVHPQARVQGVRLGELTKRGGRSQTTGATATSPAQPRSWHPSAAMPLQLESLLSGGGGGSPCTHTPTSASAVEVDGDVGLSPPSTAAAAAAGTPLSRLSRSANTYLCITVSDTGCGMTEHEVERSVYPFTQSGEDAGAQGAGLGLHVVLASVLAHHGFLTISSALGVGTSVQMGFQATAIPPTPMGTRVQSGGSTSSHVASSPCAYERRFSHGAVRTRLVRASDAAAAGKVHRSSDAGSTSASASASGRASLGPLAAHVQQEEARSMGESAPGDVGTVLVVDDQVVNAKMLQRQVQRALGPRVSVQVAFDGRQAVEAVHAASELAQEAPGSLQPALESPTAAQARVHAGAGPTSSAVDAGGSSQRDHTVGSAMVEASAAAHESGGEGRGCSGSTGGSIGQPDRSASAPTVAFQGGPLSMSSHPASAISLIFMDMNMPNMDGLEATRRIRRLPLQQQPFIVMMTGNAGEADRRAAMDAGVNAFEAKPCRKEVLYDYMARAGFHVAPQSATMEMGSSASGSSSAVDGHFLRGPPSLSFLSGMAPVPAPAPSTQALSPGRRLLLPASPVHGVSRHTQLQVRTRWPQQGGGSAVHARPTAAGLTRGARPAAGLALPGAPHGAGTAATPVLLPALPVHASGGAIQPSAEASEATVAEELEGGASVERGGVGSDSTAPAVLPPSSASSTGTPADVVPRVYA